MTESESSFKELDADEHKADLKEFVDISAALQAQFC
jgi:hypothetical protein